MKPLPLMTYLWAVHDCHLHEFMTFYCKCIDDNMSRTQCIFSINDLYILAKKKKILKIEKASKIREDERNLLSYKSNWVGQLIIVSTSTQT